MEAGGDIMAEEKMIPLDTSGNSVEVTLKEEENTQEIDAPESNIREIIEEETVETPEQVAEDTTEDTDETSEETDPYKTDDLKDYSKGVKKRINQG